MDLKRNYVTLPLSKEDINKYYNNTTIKQDKDKVVDTYFHISKNIKKNKKKIYHSNIHNTNVFITNYDNTIINIHDYLLDRYNQLGFLNKSKIENFTNMIIDNIYFNNNNNSIINRIVNEEIPIVEDTIDDSYNSEINDKYYYI